MSQIAPTGTAVTPALLVWAFLVSKSPARARIPSRSYIIFSKLKNTNNNIMALKPGPKRTATSTGKPDKHRSRANPFAWLVEQNKQ